MLTVGVLFGGRSGEHDVSLCSAASVISALDRNLYNVVPIAIDRDGIWYVQDEAVIVDDPDFGSIMSFEKKGKCCVNHYEQSGKLVLQKNDTNGSVVIDVVFPVIHGTFCEDGTLQGMLELSMVPFVGAGMTGSAIGIDKDISKRLLRDGNVPVVPWRTLTERQLHGDEKYFENIIEELGLPLFVKPASTGSSVGIKKVHSLSEFAGALEFALQFDTKVLVEKSINAREIECAVLGNDDPEASLPGEVVPNHEFYSYEAKYIDANGASLFIPANIDDEIILKIQKYAVSSYGILNCSGMARVDFFLDRDNGDIYFNEINTLPGFTSISMYPKLWQATGLGYEDLLNKLIELAFEKHLKKNKIRTTI